MYRIGVIATKQSLKWIKKIEPFVNDQCELFYMSYAHPSEIKPLYLKNHLFFDGMIFSGQLPYVLIEKECGTFPVPTVYFDVGQKDFYKTICKVMVQERQFDFSRTLIDFIFKDNHYLGLNDFLNEQQFPYHFGESLEDYKSVTIYEEMFERHQMLWDSGKIDLSFTRTSGLTEKLADYGINHIVMFPSAESMLEKIHQLIKEIDLIRLSDSQIVMGNISIRKTEESPNNNHLELQRIKMNKALLEYIENGEYSFIIQKNLNHFDIITSYGDLKGVTNNFTSCSLYEFLKQELPFSFNIGWGIGNTIDVARTNALLASQLSEDRKEQASFIITEDEQIIGPLGESNCLTVSHSLDPEVEKLSQQTGVASLKIKKILATMQKSNTNEFSADDLAAYLGVSTRSTNRILNKLEEAGKAEVVYKKQQKLRGRPKKIYRIMLYIGMTD